MTQSAGTADEDVQMLTVTGTEFQVRNPDNPALLVTGKCTGQGVEGARIHRSGAGAVSIPIAIRAQ